MISAQNNYRLLGEDFDEKRSRRTFWLFFGIAVAVVVGAVVAFFSLGDGGRLPGPSIVAQVDTQARAPVIGAPAPRAYPEVVDTGEGLTAGDLARVAPSAGVSEEEAAGGREALIREMFGPVAPEATEGAGIARERQDLVPAVTRPLAVVDVDGRLVGPVVHIDPTAGVNQDIRFTLSPELADITNYREAFRLPLGDMAVITLADGSYALQLDEQQTRFLASYLLRVGGFDTQP